jgi:hypothetical protein
VIIFESGSAINPAFGGGGTALIANGTGGGHRHDECDGHRQQRDPP